MCRQGGLIFRQLFEPVSCTYTYLVGCSTTKRAIIIDPVLETVKRDAKLIKELGLDLVYGLNTHVHADHVTGTGELKRCFPKMQSVLCISCTDVAKADHYVKHKDIIDFGGRKIEVRSTPGHTNGCLTYVNHQERQAFTGDSLFIRGCGRTDFQEGCAKKLYNSIHSEIFSLPDNYLIYPGHDYTGQTVSTVAEEKKFNPRLTIGEEKFVEFMKNLKLPYPNQIDKSIPANKLCGIYENMDQRLQEIVFGKEKPSIQGSCGEVKPAPTMAPCGNHPDSQGAQKTFERMGNPNNTKQGGGQGA